MIVIPFLPFCRPLAGDLRRELAGVLACENGGVGGDDDDDDNDANIGFCFNLHFVQSCLLLFSFF